MSLDLSNSTNLVKSITGVSDDEVLAQTEAAGGVETVLDLMFGEMVSVFTPDANAEKRSTIAHELPHPGGVARYVLVVENGACQLVKGDEPAQVTITASYLDYLRLASKELAGMQAFSSGRFKIAGDMGLTMKMAKWFPEVAV